MNIFKSRYIKKKFQPPKMGKMKFFHTAFGGLMKKPPNITIGIQYSNLSLKIPPPYIHKSNGEIGLPSCLFTNFVANINK